MLLFILSALWANPKADVEYGIHGILGDGDIVLRKRIQERLQQELIMASSLQSIWIVDDQEQRRRIQFVEDELSCSGDCILPIAQKIRLDFVIVGTLDLIQKEGESIYQLEMSLFSVDEKTEQQQVVIKESQSTAILERLREVAKAFLSTRAEEEIREPENPIEQAKQYLLNIETTPKGAIVLSEGGVLCRSTPCSVFVQEGKQEISVQLEEYEAWTETRVITENTDINLRLEPTFALLELTGNSDFQVWIDGVQMSRVPIYNHRLAEGKHLISVNDPCFFRSDQQLVAQKGK